ncbi:hypothetical protein NQ314_007300, partial [Rhamnusium bicolor]
FVNSPICCPSRSTILTGKYAHNTGVVNNSIDGNCSSESWQKYHEPFSVAALLKNEKDYVTFYAGKYLNQKHWIVDMPPTHLPANITILDNIQKHRLQSLLAVDEMMEKVVKKLEQLNLLENTYILFTSDNGFHIGQFTQPWDKRQPYDTDIRVPLFVSGPNIPRKNVESYPVSSVDLAPTILDLAGVNIPQYMDGKSFKKVLFSTNQAIFKKHLFVEYWGEGQKATVDTSCPWSYDGNVAVSPSCTSKTTPTRTK